MSFRCVSVWVKLEKVNRINHVASGVVLTNINPGFDAHLLAAGQIAIEFQASMPRGHRKWRGENYEDHDCFIGSYRQFKCDFNDDGGP